MMILQRSNPILYYFASVLNEEKARVAALAFSFACITSHFHYMIKNKINQVFFNFMIL